MLTRHLFWMHETDFFGLTLPFLLCVTQDQLDAVLCAVSFELRPSTNPQLMAWHANFKAAWPELKSTYGDRFYRMWEYYLLSCAGGFRSRRMQLWQMVMTKPGRKRPDCRVS